MVCHESMTAPKRRQVLQYAFLCLSCRKVKIINLFLVILFQHLIPLYFDSYCDLDRSSLFCYSFSSWTVISCVALHLHEGAIKI